jgi:hypothetical protein
MILAGSIIALLSSALGLEFEPKFLATQIARFQIARLAGV